MSTATRPTLCEIFARYQARDGGRSGTDKNTDHTYGPLYERLLESKRDTATEVLEVGVFAGFSVLSWVEYFSQAAVTGLDIDLGNLRIDPATVPRLRLHRVNAASQQSLHRVLGAPTARYDMILDDASHIPDHQVETFRVLAPYLKRDGLYIIEDIDNRFTATLQAQLGDIARGYGMTMEWYDLRSETNTRFDDIVAVFRYTA